MGAAVAFIDGILATDRQAPRKQRHTAHRIHERIVTEMPEVGISESSVRKCVRERKLELGWGGRETFVPQSYSLGQEGQVDWKEAYLDFEEEPRKVQAFRMRSMASGGAFHRAYPHATQQAFPEAHESAFSYFGGVFGNLRHDNTEECREEDLSRLPARGDGTIHWLPFALGIHSGVLHSGAGTGERRSGGRERILPPERMPLGKAIPDVARRVGRSVRGVQAEGWRTLMVDATGVGVPVVDLPRRGGLG